MIERTFGASFKFPKLHKETPVIDGLMESSVSLITMEDKQEVSLGIWGLLPETFKDDWQYFQDVQNTLNVDMKGIKEDQKYKGVLENRRCLVLVTGFFTYYLHHGDLYPYYVHLESDNPFAIAGVYNRLDDGFITCSIIVSKANSFIKKIHNSNTMMPVVLNKSNQRKWLDLKTEDDVLTTIADTTSQLKFKAHPIAKEFHKMGVNYDSVLDPVDYNNIPKHF